MAALLATASCGGDTGGGGGGPDAAPADAPPVFAGAAQATPLSGAVRLTWQPATDDVTAATDLVYLVYQSQQSGGQDFTAPALETAPGATEAVVTGLALDTTYYFVVRARDAAGHVDANTAEVSATTPAVADTEPPSFAGVDTATPIGSTAMELTWQPAMDDTTPADAIAYLVYVSENAGGQDFTAAAVTTAAGATSALVTGLTESTDYFFVVRAQDTSGNQDTNTTEVQGTTGGPVSFAADIEPLLDGTCARPGCHTGVVPAQGLDLSSGSAYASLVAVPASQCSDGRVRVAPGDPDASYLVDKLLGVDLCAGTLMPKGAPLTPAQIQIIRDWVAAGASEN
jgi:hypothetical protein